MRGSPVKIAQSTVAIIASHAEISFQKFLKMLTTMAVEIIINYKPPPPINASGTLVFIFNDL